MKIPDDFEMCPDSGGGAGSGKREHVIKQILLAPIWTRIGVPYIIFREGSDSDTLGPQFYQKWQKVSKLILNRNLEKSNDQIKTQRY